MWNIRIDENRPYHKWRQNTGPDTIEPTGKTIVNLALNPVSLKISPDSKNSVTVNYVVKERQ